MSIGDLYTAASSMQYAPAMTELNTQLAVEREWAPRISEAGFRDFVVWMCGFTSREQPPDLAEWNDLRDRVKDVAAEFAIHARAVARKRLKSV